MPAERIRAVAFVVGALNSCCTGGKGGGQDYHSRHGRADDEDGGVGGVARDKSRGW